MSQKLINKYFSKNSQEFAAYATALDNNLPTFLHLTCLKFITFSPENFFLNLSQPYKNAIGKTLF